jgi:polyisoprenoid-binding protein YceI
MTVQTATRQATWQIDPSHTTVGFAVKHMVVTTVKGHFGKVSGSIELDEADPTNSTIRAEIEAASIDTRWPDRDAHLRSADFLDAEAYPTITFQSTSIERDGDAYTLRGDLTIRGISRPVTLKAEFNGIGNDPWGGTRAGFSAEGKLDRKLWNMTWNGALEAGGLLVGDEVKLSLDVEAIKQES